MADEEKKYLITAEAQVQNALAGLAQLESALTRLGEAERRVSSTIAPLSNFASQTQSNIDAINREIAAYENLNRVRQEQGRLIQSTQQTTTRFDDKGTPVGTSYVNTKTLEAENRALREVVTQRGTGNVLESETRKVIANQRAQDALGATLTNVTTTRTAGGGLQELVVTSQNIAGSFRETNRVLVENGNVISRTATEYNRVGGEIRGTTRSVEEFARTVSNADIDKLAERESQTMLRDMEDVRRQATAARTIRQESYAQLDTARRADPQGATQTLANQPFTNITRTTDAAGKVQELAVSYQNVAGKVMETNRVLTENGVKVSQTATNYKVLDGQIRGTTKITEEFAQTAEQSANTLGHFMSRMRFMAEWFAFYAVIQLVQKGLQDWNQAQIALSDEMANFEIVTRGSNASAEAYLTTVNAISKATAINPAEIGPGVVAQMRVFNAPSDLALRAAQVQRVTGVDNAQVQREIMGLRLQFPDRSTINILDAFSGALKRSSLSAEELFGLLETAGPLSQQFNTGLEQILGMMAGLSTVTSESGQAVELYMRQMDRLYSDPKTRGKVEQFTGKPVVGTDLTTGQEVRRPLYDVMADISKLDQSQVQEIANTIPNALGQKTRQLFVAMVNGWANVEDATKSALGAQGEFLSQNETKMKSYTAAIEGVGAAWQRVLRGFGDSSAAITVLREVASWLDYIAKVTGDMGAGGVAGFKAGVLSSPLGIAAAAAVRYSPIGIRQRAEEQRQIGATERREFLQDRLDRGAGSAPSQAWASSVRFPEQQVTTVSRSATALAERFYEQAMQQRVQGAATFMMGGPTENKAYIESIKQMIGVNEQQIAVVNELTGEVVVTTKDQVMYQDALKRAAEILNRTPEEWAQSFLRGREPASLWGGKTPEDYQIPKQKFELPAMGFDFTVARKLMQENIASYRSQFPEAVQGKTDTEVLNLMGISERFTTFTDRFGNALGSVDIPLQYLANAAASAAGALAGLSFISPPEGVSLGTFGAGIEARAGYYDKLLTANSAEPPKTRKQIFADETGTYETKGEFSDQAIALANAAEGKYWSKALANSQQANELLKQIAAGVRSFAEKLLAPTAVTEGDMALAKTGGYKDKWDEPVRKIQDVLDRRAGDNPNLGPWKGFAESMGIDLSSKASTVATGEQFKSKFYSGQMSPEFYDQYSKEGFLAAAKEELAAQKGKERLTDQAVGWLKESGMDKDVSKFIGRKMTGDVSPIEDMLYAGKDPKKVGKDIEASAKPIGDGLVKGIGSAFTFDALYSALEAGWKLKDAEAQKKIMSLGGQVGALLTSGAATSFGDKFLDAVIAAVMARLDKEYL